MVKLLQKRCFMQHSGSDKVLLAGSSARRWELKDFAAMLPGATAGGDSGCLQGLSPESRRNQGTSSTAGR